MARWLVSMGALASLASLGWTAFAAAADAVPDKKGKFWAFQPPQAVEPPHVNDKQWAKSAVDQFVLAALEANKLKPVGDADRRTWVRRVTLDLVGLIPTPAEVDAFVNNKSPKAAETVVDRLLYRATFSDAQLRNRSIYLPIVRNAMPEALELFDAPDPSLVIGVRDVTTVPSQSLFLMNSQFLVQQSRHFAERLLAVGDLGDSARVALAFRIALNREPSANESAESTEFVKRSESVGGGIKGGLRYGASDEFGIKAVENKVHPHDLHATILHLLGLDHEKLTYRYGGRDYKLTGVGGARVVNDIIV